LLPNTNTWVERGSHTWVASNTWVAANTWVKGNEGNSEEIMVAVAVAVVKVITVMARSWR
jgi:hypothetical protein